jgi:exopolysaccharide biosynthesis polyprenyl glycosylphosphotransferase
MLMAPSTPQEAPAGPPLSPNRSHSGAPVQLVAGAPLLFAMEAALPSLLLVTVLLTANLGAMPGGVESFLALRVTVKNVFLCLGFGAGCVAILLMCRVYDARAVRLRQSEAARILLAASLCTGLALVFPATSLGGGVEFHQLSYLWSGLMGAEIVLRGARRVIARRSRERPPRRVIIAGTGPRALRVWEEFTADDSTAYELVGFVDTQLDPGAPADVERQRLGTVQDLERLLMQQAIDEVFVALPVKSHYREFQHAIEVCERVGVRTKYQADMFTTSVAWARIEAGLHWVVTMNVAPDDYRLAFKRALDLCGALSALAIFSPVMALAAVAIKLTSAGPVLFTQERYGLNKRPFRMMKFRTMVVNAHELQATLESRNEADGPVFKIANDPRVTWVGRFLRKTSVDELPQLFNVLRGEMSLVGPRPLPARDVQRITRGSDMRRFSVIPGLTCLWQISGRNQLGFNEWVQLDLQYIDGWSLVEDLRILVKTIPAVLRGTGAS